MCRDKIDGMKDILSKNNIILLYIDHMRHCYTALYATEAFMS